MTRRKKTKMDTQQRIDSALKTGMAIGGAMAIALVEQGTGMILGQAGDPGFPLDVAAAGNAEVLKSKLNTMHSIGIKDNEIVDIMITLDSQFHIIRPLASDRALFAYLVVRSDANLALARRGLAQIAAALKV